MGRKQPLSQVTVKRNAGDEASVDFFRHIEDRDRELYPTIFSYLNAAVELLEVSVGNSGDFPLLTEADFQQIELTVLDALRIYDTKKKDARMAP